MIFYIHNYNTRRELEEEIRSQVGTDPVNNSYHTISGTEQELANFNLSPRTNVYGVRCIVTEE